MYRLFLRSLASATLVALSTSATNAVVLTFDGVPNGEIGCPPNPTSIVESGFTISNCPGWFIEPGEIHLDDGGSSFQDSVGFSSSRPFDAISVAIQGLGSSFLDLDSDELVPYDNVLFEGFQDGTLVASQSYSTFSLDVLQIDAVLFGSDFALLDLLIIRQVLPGADDFLRFPNAECFDSPCAHVSLKEITVSPIPLPPGLPLLLTALAIVGHVRWRRAGRGAGSPRQAGR
jgi:hypothetical protein